MSYDKKFIAVDETAYEDGKPVDTWLRSRIRANHEEISQGIQPVVTAFVAGSHAPDNKGTLTNDRAWCNYGSWAYTVCIPYWLEPNMAGVRLELALKRPGLGYVQLKASLWMAPHSSRLGTTELDTSAVTEYFEPHVVEVNLAAPYVGQKRWGTLKVGVQSYPDFDDAGTPYTVNGVNQRLWSVTANISYPANNPTYDSWDTRVIMKDTGEVTDIIGMNPATDTLFVEEALFGPTVIAAPSFSVETFPLSFLQCRSVGINPLYGPSSVGRSQLEAFQVESGQTATTQAALVDTLWKRRTLIGWGPRGYRPPERGETWGSGNPIRFPVVQGTPDPTLNQATIIQDGLHWRKGLGGKLIVAVYCYPLFRGITQPTTGDWDFTLKVQRPDGSDTDWASPEGPVTTPLSSVRRVKLRVFPATPVQTGTLTYNNNTKFIQTSAWMRGGYNTTPDYSDWKYGHREGMLFDDDMANLQLVVLELDASDIPDNWLGSLRCEAVYVNNSLEEGAGFNPGYKLTLTNVGYSVWAEK